tara:strand:- start:249 stop:437 length:189 start_codon:yes stop_codon:yes gene_type:complete
MADKSELKIGDWVRVVMVGINDQKNEPAYRIENIDGDDYHVVQTEGSYKHRMKVKKGKLKKL